MRTRGFTTLEVQWKNICNWVGARGVKPGSTVHQPHTGYHKNKQEQVVLVNLRQPNHQLDTAACKNTQTYKTKKLMAF